MIYNFIVSSISPTKNDPKGTFAKKYPWDNMKHAQVTGLSPVHVAVFD